MKVLRRTPEKLGLDTGVFEKLKKKGKYRISKETTDKRFKY